MGLGGAVFGGILGSIVGGPIGAAFGAMLGHSLETDRPKKSGVDERDRTARHIIAGLASMLARVAHADSTVNERERALIHEICRNYAVQWGLGQFINSDNELEAVVDAGMKHPQAGMLIITRARKQERLAMDLLHQLWRVAASDGRIADSERAVLGGLAHELGLGEEQAAQVAMFFLRTDALGSAATARERADAARVLGISAEAGPEDIKRAYRSQAMKWHPDRHPGNSKEAEERTAAINHARDVMLDGGASAGEALLAWSDSGNRLEEPHAGAVVRCFLCETRNRLPAAEHLHTARCARCQALVLYSSQLAQKLFAARR